MQNLHTDTTESHTPVHKLRHDSRKHPVRSFIGLIFVALALVLSLVIIGTSQDLRQRAKEFVPDQGVDNPVSVRIISIDNKPVDTNKTQYYPGSDQQTKTNTTQTQYYPGSDQQVNTAKKTTTDEKNAAILSGDKTGISTTERNYLLSGDKTGLPYDSKSTNKGANGSITPSVSDINNQQTANSDNNSGSGNDGSSGSKKSGGKSNKGSNMPVVPIIAVPALTCSGPTITRLNGGSTGDANATMKTFTPGNVVGLSCTGASLFRYQVILDGKTVSQSDGATATYAVPNVPGNYQVNCIPLQ